MTQFVQPTQLVGGLRTAEITITNTASALIPAPSTYGFIRIASSQTTIYGTVWFRTVTSFATRKESGGDDLVVVASGAPGEASKVSISIEASGIKIENQTGSTRVLRILFECV
jgi:hypothetical protein